MMESAIVIGGNHHNTLGVIRSLGKNGIFSDVIMCCKGKDSYVLKSKFINKSCVVSNYNEAVNILLHEWKTEEKQVVICASDGAASSIDKHRYSLINSYYLPGCEEQGRLTMLMNKSVMTDLAIECGLNVPKSVVLDKNGAVSNDVPFPCILKPIKSIDGSKSDISVCRSDSELVEKLKSVRSDKIQAQSFIEKVLEYQLIGLSWGGVIIPGRTHIISQPLVTNTGFLRYEHLDGTEPIDECKSFIRETGYSGLFSMEFIRDKAGIDYFMEINFRNDGNSICVTEAGVNLPSIWYSLCKNPRLELESIDLTIKDIYVMPEFDEIRLWSAQEISLRRFYKEMKQADIYMEYSPEDPHPTHGKIDFWKKFLITALFKRPGRIMLGRNKKR